ncbi:MAG: hypothetical protein ACPLZF_04510 [Nitrososphaeria archaeon]
MRNMITWSKAFYKGFIILLWSILWGIVGFLLFSLIISSILTGVLVSFEDPTQIINNPQILQQIVAQYAWPIMLAFILIFAIISVAVYATLVKVIGNTVLDEVKKTSPLQTIPVPPPPPPPPIEPEK